MVVEVGAEAFQVLTANISPFGAKLTTASLSLELGMLAELHFHPSEGTAIDVQAIVWRTDPDGHAFFFIGLGEHTFPPGTTERES